MSSVSVLQDERWFDLGSGTRSAKGKGDSPRVCTFVLVSPQQRCPPVLSLLARGDVVCARLGLDVKCVWAMGCGAQLSNVCLLNVKSVMPRIREKFRDGMMDRYLTMEASPKDAKGVFRVARVARINILEHRDEMALSSISAAIAKERSKDIAVDVGPTVKSLLFGIVEAVEHVLHLLDAGRVVLCAITWPHDKNEI